MFVENYHSFTETQDGSRVSVTRSNPGQPSTSLPDQLKNANAEEYKAAMSQPVVITKGEWLAMQQRYAESINLIEIVSKAAYKGLPNDGKRRYIKELENSSNIEQAADLSGVTVGWAKTQASNAKNNGK